MTIGEVIAHGDERALHIVEVFDLTVPDHGPLP
jgi:hypothetical protein